MTKGRTFLLWMTVIPLVVAALLVGGFAWVATPSFPVRDGVVYAAEDPAAGGWVLATVSEDGDLSECSVPDAALGASRSDGARTLLLPRAEGAPRPLVLHPVADAWSRTRTIGLPLFGRAACRQRMVTHLRWTASRGPGPWDALWSAREQAMTIRLAQGDPDEQPPYTWTTWTSDLRWDELSSRPFHLQFLHQYLLRPRHAHGTLLYLF